MPSGAPRGSSAVAEPAAHPLSDPLRVALAAEPGGREGLRAFYEARGGRPLWITADGPRPEAYELLKVLENAGGDGLDPHAYRPDKLALELAIARAGGPVQAARAELALSRAYAAYLKDLRTPPGAAQLEFTDPDLAPPPTTPRRVLEAAATAVSLSDHLQAARRMNPVYEQLRAALAVHRAKRPVATAPDATERLILANMARARALPADLGRRHIIVDVAAGHLWLYEDGRAVDQMPVAIGRRSAATPSLSGVMRYVRFNPYWNLPEGMIREEIAPRVLREGPGFLEASGMEALSDWSSSARVLGWREIDWAAVARGDRPLRLRQRPGPQNILGDVKLMLPNDLGIYLHDTPDKAVFQRAQRTVSAGCIRLADAERLTRRLLRWSADRPFPGGVNTRVDLPEAVPVYVVYLTVGVEDGQVVRRPDLYGRDALLLAQLASPGARA